MTLLTSLKHISKSYAFWESACRYLTFLATYDLDDVPKKSGTIMSSSPNVVFVDFDLHLFVAFVSCVAFYTHGFTFSRLILHSDRLAISFRALLGHFVQPAGHL